MVRVALVLAFAAGTAGAQDQTLSPEQDAFAREMISCGQKYVALKLVQPGTSSPMQIVTEGRVYSAAAREVAGDSFVDRETPAIRQSALEYVAKASSGDKRATVSAIADVKRECDAKLSGHLSGGR